MTMEAWRAVPRPEPSQFGHDTYLSPNTYRYGSQEMRRVWSQNRFWRNVRQIWINVAETQLEAGIVTQTQVDDLKANADKLSVERIFQIERDPNIGTGHDVAAAIIEFSEVAPIGGEILHQGLTSEDVLSNSETMQIHDAFDILRPKTVAVLEALAEKTGKYKNLPCMGYTHLQMAEPITMGYRFSKYAQDLLIDLRFADYVRQAIRAKGIKGPVGTSAGIEELLKGTGMTLEEHERRIMERMGLPYVTVSDQTYPRKFLFLAEVALASIGQSLHRYALDIQLLQSSFIDEVSEPYRRDQIGSSAMPHKRNPVNSENIDSLTELMPGYLVSSWTTGAFITLERTLRDSAGKRSWLPESFLAIDEALTRTARITRGLQIHENAVAFNLLKFAPFMATDGLLQRLSRAGMDRKVAHAILVEHSEDARRETREGKPNPMRQLVSGDERIVSLIGQEGVDEAFEEVFTHVGDAPERCDKFLQEELYPAVRN